MTRSRYGRAIALIGASVALLSYKGEIVKTLIPYSEPLAYGALFLMVIGAYKISKENERTHNSNKQETKNPYDLR